MAKREPDVRRMFLPPPEERPHRDTRDDELDLWPDDVEALPTLRHGFGAESREPRDTRDE